MKKIIFLLLLLPFLGSAQVKISGKVIDGTRPLEFATIVLNDQEGAVVSGAITDADGSFLITAEKGKYVLKASYIGLEEWTQDINLEKDVTLDNINMAGNVSTLKEVVVKAKKQLIVRKIDRLVFNVENNPSTVNGDALDVLRVSPGIAVTGDQINMIGKSGMRVMVDGRIIELSGPELVSFLSSIPADDIKAIEIISNPPARYEAEGNSGLINIIYKKGRKNSWNNRTSIGYTQADLASYTLRNNFTFQKDKVNLLMSVNARTGHTRVEQQSDIFYTNGPWFTNVIQDWKDDDLSGSLMFDYNINDRSTIGIQYLGSVRNPDIDDKAVSQIFNTSNVMDSSLISDGFSDYAISNHSLNAHYKVSLDTMGRSIALDLDYFDYQSRNDRDILAETFLGGEQFLRTSFGNTTNTQQDVKNYSVNVHVEHPIKKVNLSYGAKLTFTNSDYLTNNFNTITGTPVFDPDQSNEFKYTENNQAIYVNAPFSINDKWSAQIGLRLENTITEGFSKTLDRLDKNDYLKLFPTVYLSYDKNENNSFSLDYGRRINRPGFSSLNPARYYVNNNSYSVGNPFLQPSFSDNLEFAHVFKRNLTSIVFFSMETDGYGPFLTPLDATNESFISTENYFRKYNYGLAEFYTFDKVSRWTSQLGLYFFGYQSEVTNDAINVQTQNGFRSYFSSNNTIAIDKEKMINAQVNFWYSTPYKDGLTDYSESYKLDLAMVVNLSKQNMQLSFGIYDVFNSSPKLSTSFVNDLKQTYIRYPSNRYFRVGLTYMTGNKKVRVRQRRFGNEEEKRRAG